MSFNKEFLDKMAAQAEQEPEIVDLNDLEDEKIDDNSGQAESKPITVSQTQESTELEQLRAELAKKAEELEALKLPKTEMSEGEKTANSDGYYTDEEIQQLNDQLGEDVANVLMQSNMRNMQKISALESFANTQKANEGSAAFIRAAGSDALKTFNSPEFQTFAKGEMLGRKSLYDELTDIVKTNDLAGVEFLSAQVSAFNQADKVIRKAQVGAGRSVNNGQAQPQSYDAKKAEKLQNAIYSARFGSPERKKASDKYSEYLDAIN